MGTVYARGQVLWVSWTDRDGARQWKSTKLRVGQEKKAADVLRVLEAQAEAGEASHDTFEGFWRGVWMPLRRPMVTNPKDEEDAIRLHALPVFGAKRLEEISFEDLLRLIARMEGKDLAPRTIRNALAAVRPVFKHAKRKKLISESPFVDLERGEIPKVTDKNPEWRATADFERHEVEALCFDRRLPLWHRIDWAIGGMTGSRAGERFFLRLRHWDRTKRPLTSLAFAGSFNSKIWKEKPTKTGVARYFPVHPALEAMLAEWVSEGWAAYVGRAPTPNDLLVPFVRSELRGKAKADPLRRTVPVAYGLLQGDLATLGLRQRRNHDFRVSLINVADEDGARENIMKRLTHPSPTEAFHLYKRTRWPVLCAEVAKLQFRDSQRDTSEGARAEFEPARNIRLALTEVGSPSDGGGRIGPKRKNPGGNVTVVTPRGHLDYETLALRVFNGGRP